MSISSHKVIPRVVLKNFASADGGLFFWIDFSSAPKYFIRRGLVKSFNTEEDYYTEEVEALLSKTVETDIKNVLERAPSIQDEELELDELTQDSAYKYLEALFSRDSSFHEEREESPSDIVMTMTRLLKDSGTVRNIFNVSYLINNSNVPFTLPSNGIIQINNTEIICPLSPQIALRFYNSEENCYKVVDEDDLVMEINKNAFRQVLANKCSALICNQKIILEEIRNDYLSSLSTKE